jgi:hypothetical protein
MTLPILEDKLMEFLGLIGHLEVNGPSGQRHSCRNGRFESDDCCASLMIEGTVSLNHFMHNNIIVLLQFEC